MQPFGTMESEQHIAYRDDTGMGNAGDYARSAQPIPDEPQRVQAIIHRDPLHDPHHTQTQERLMGQSGYWVGLTTAAIARYLPRAITDYAFKNNPPSLDAKIDTISGMLAKRPITLANEALEKGDKAGAENILRVFGTSRSDAEKHIKTLGEGEKSLTPAITRDVANASAKRLYNFGYDASLGFGSIWLTTAYRNKVKYDMGKLYSEAVAYEDDKQPGDIDYGALKESDNAVVKETLGHLKYRSSWRYGTDALFFGRHLLYGLEHALGRKAVPFLGRMLPTSHLDFGEAALGAKGAMLIYDTWGRKLTTFEKLNEFVERKLKPLNGLGEEITGSDLVDIFQHFSMRNAPELAFTDIASKDIAESMRWTTANRIFSRAAELMNETYSYKHETKLDAATSLPEAPENFSLPEFIYLLGHGLFDPKNSPEATLAYVEVANHYGIPAVKKMHHQLQRGLSLELVTAQFPEIEEQMELLKAPLPVKWMTRHKSTHPAAATQHQQRADAQAPETLQDTATPSPHIEQAEMRERLEKTPAQHVH